MLVREHMTTPTVTITATETLQSALRVMDAGQVRRLPVVEPGCQRLVGVVTERDLLLAADHYLMAPVDVEQFMTRAVVTATPEMPLAEAARRMTSHHIGGLPVVDDDGQ